MKYSPENDFYARDTERRCSCGETYRTGVLSCITQWNLCATEPALKVDFCFLPFVSK